MRELVFGIALLALEAYDEWRGVTLVLASLVVLAVGDFFIIAIHGGWWQSFKSHFGPTAIASWAVWKLWQEHMAGV